MNKQVTAEVTADDIEWGVPCNSRNCPVARALARSFPDLEVHVGPTYIAAYTNEQQFSQLVWNITTPDVIKTFMELFDSGEFPHPFTFTIEVPEVELIDAGAHSEGGI